MTRTPRLTSQAIEQIKTARDAEWTSTVLGIPDKSLTPEQAAKWLANDRVYRARNVTAARMRRTPPNW